MNGQGQAKSWTPADDEQLKSLITAGLPPDEVAAELKRTKSAVYQRAHRFGLSFQFFLKKRVKSKT